MISRMGTDVFLDLSVPIREIIRVHLSARTAVPPRARRERADPIGSDIAPVADAVTEDFRANSLEQNRANCGDDQNFPPRRSAHPTAQTQELARG